MLKRKITKQLEDWKQSKNKKALVIKGMRQIGKTFIVKKFAEDNYKNVIYINFKESESFKKIFDGDLDISTLITNISASVLSAKFIPFETIIILDEIQECANARTSLKTFVLDGRFDVIATGSLLGIKGYNKNNGKGIPTGYEHILYMKPMDFEEFLWAKGIDENVIDYLKDCYKNKKPIREVIHEKMIRYYKEYICVGGLPRIVDIFVETSDLNRVYDEQKDILEDYKDDFGKHLDEDEKEKTNFSLLANINRVYDSIPSQLAKENKKFVYSLLGKNSRGSEYQTAIQWLYDFGFINICYNLSMIDRPLEGYRIDNIFKIYVQDSGLFVAMLEKGTATRIINDDMNVYKGAIFENIIADSFSKNDKKLFYYHKESGLEIDFATVIDDKTTIIEVKAVNGNSKSAKVVMNSNNHIDQCIKLGKYNIGKNGNIITMPYYLSFLLK